MASNERPIWLEVADAIEAASVASDHRARRYLRCASCGKGFRGWQHPQRDESKNESENLYIKCCGDDCDLCGANVYVSHKNEDEPMIIAAVERMVRRWNRRQIEVKPAPKLKEVDSDILIAELARRINPNIVRPEGSIGYVFPPKTEDGKLTFSLWGSQ